MEKEEQSTRNTEDDGPITFEDLGIRKAVIKDSPMGKRRELADIQKKEIIFVVLTVISLLAVFVLAIIKVAELVRDNNCKNPDFTFALILLANTVFCAWYLIQSILTERPYEILVLVLASVIILLYIIINFALSANKGVVKLVRLVITCILSPFIIFLGLWIAKEYHESGRLIFRTVGANSDLQNKCKTMFAFLGALKFDLQLGVTMVLLILTTGITVNIMDIVILAVGIPITIVCFFLGYLCIRLENKLLAGFYVPSLLLAPAYFIYKIIQSAQFISQDNLGIAGTTFVCAGLAMIVRVILAILFVLTFRNFGNGLKEKVYGHKSPGTDENTDHSNDRDPAIQA